MCIKMLHVFQIVESIHEMLAGFTLEYQSNHTRNIFNMFFSLHTVFYKQVVFTHSYLMICVQTLNDAGCKIKIWNALMSQRRSLQAETLLSI